MVHSPDTSDLFRCCSYFMFRSWRRETQVMVKHDITCPYFRRHWSRCSHLAEFFVDRSREVHAIKRRTSSLNILRVDHIYEDPHTDNAQFSLHYGDLTDSSKPTRIIQETQPNKVCILRAQDHVAVSFEAPEYTSDVDAMATLRLLEAIRFLGLEN